MSEDVTSQAQDPKESGSEDNSSESGNTQSVEPMADKDSSSAQLPMEQVQAENSAYEGSLGDKPLTPDSEARLQQLEEEHETLRSQYMRIAADFDNFRKRQSRDQDDLRVQLTCTTLSEILPVVDNFERARQQLDPQGEEAQALHRSYQGLYKQLVDVLKQLGVAPMRVVGQSFDPNLHEAVLREPSDEHPEDVVIEELQRGYHLNGRVLRHALVKVSMGSQKSPINDSGSDQETSEPIPDELVSPDKENQ